MTNKYKLIDIQDVKDANGNLIPGKNRLMCVNSDAGGVPIECFQTYETINKFGATTTLPQINTEFIGDLHSNRVYILKWIDPVIPARLENLTTIPTYFSTGVPDAPGDIVNRMNPMASSEFRTNGYWKTAASADTYIEMIPDPKTFSPLGDRIHAQCKNFLLRTFGGFLSWANFDREGHGVFESELMLTAQRGDPIAETKSKDNEITIQMGSLVDDEDKIFKMTVIVTDTSTSKTSTHVVSIGTAGINIDSVLPDNNTTHSTVIDSNGLSDVYSVNGKKTTVTITETGVDVNTDADVKVECQNMTAAVVTDLKVTCTDADINASGDVTAECANLTVTSKAVKITGGTLETNGTVTPTGSGPYNCLTACAFTGILHVGNKVSGT